MAFGMGGGLLQKNNRDTLKFAMKACARHTDGVWIDIYKDPTIYDPTTWKPISSSFKKSMAGRLELMHDAETNEYKTVRIGEEARALYDIGYRPMLETVYDNGTLVRDMTFAEVRKNARLPAEKLRITAAEEATTA